MPKSGCMLTSVWSIKCSVCLKFPVPQCCITLKNIFTKLLLSYLRNRGNGVLHACNFSTSFPLWIWIFILLFWGLFAFRISLVWYLPRSNRKSPRKREQNSQSHTRKPPAYCSAVMRRYWRARLGWNGLQDFTTGQNIKLFIQEQTAMSLAMPT